MSTRISTAGIHSAAIAQLSKQQTALVKTQAQVASGKRLQAPSDDPIATMRILSMEQGRANIEQYNRNSDILQSRLNLSEQALGDISSLLQNVRDRALQANNAAMDRGALGSLAAEIRARSQELLDIANRRDGNGEYLFGGFSTSTQPFSKTSSGVSYVGDQGVRTLQIGTDQRVPDGFTGTDIFLRIPEGNGTFTTATGVHNGSGSIDTGQVVTQANWVPDTYAINFTSDTTWEVRDSSAVLVASGNYVAGGSIAFNGVSVTVNGAPASGDSFTVAPAVTKDIFTMLDELASSLENAGTTASGKSLVNTAVASGLTQIDQSLDKVLNTRAIVGIRLGTIDNAQSSRDELDDQLAESVGNLRDVDYAAAIAQMNQQLTSLQAAQAAYSRIAQLSLFDYL